jgi:glucose repression regulatory protein TUP1
VHQHEPGLQYTLTQTDEIGNQLSEYDPDKLPSNLKKHGDDWYAVFNPRTRRQLDVDLVHSLSHSSVVCCVRFSADGRYVATGCNRSAQIFDVASGLQVCHLSEPSANPEGDLYIRSVCFSPNGQMLATGAEDKIIRVSRHIGTHRETSGVITDIVTGMGHCYKADSASILRSRAGHLLSRLCFGRAIHRIGIW